MNSPEYNFYQHFFAARAGALEFAESEKLKLKSGKKPYRNYNSSISNYEESFQEVTDLPFSEFLSGRRQKKGKVFTLDVMGTGGFTDELPIDGQVAITLNEFRTPDSIKSDLLKDRYVIPGNVLTGVPWGKARQFIREKDHTQLQGYDLAILRPADAGWRGVNNGCIFDDDDYIGCIEWLIVKRTMNLLSPDGGIAFIEYNDGSWLPNLQRH